MGRRNPPDPAWRRRALLAGALIVALAEPHWPSRVERITLWIDDSLSMLTREPQGRRLAEAAAHARAMLEAIPGAEVEVRTLGEPWHDLGSLSEAVVEGIAARAGRSTAGPPPAALLRGDRQQWLITDGTKSSLVDWPGKARPDRVIQVANVGRNVGLERLSARRNPNDPDRVDLLLKVTNGGATIETRVVTMESVDGEVARVTRTIDAGASVHVELSAQASAGFRARLDPGDALPEDDTIAVDTSPLRRRKVAHDPSCPASLAAAIASHPALALASAAETDVEAALDCRVATTARQVPTIRVRVDPAPVPVRGPAQWSADVPGSRRIRLDAERLRAAARLFTGPDDAVLLAMGDLPLIVRRAGKPAVLETALDLGGPSGVGRGPETPLLVNLMFEQLLHEPLLEALAITDRGAGASNVVPLTRPSAAGSDARHARWTAVRDWTRAVVVVAVVLLLWELAALALQWRRLASRVGFAAG